MLNIERLLTDEKSTDFVKIAHRKAAAVVGYNHGADAAQEVLLEIWQKRQKLFFDDLDAFWQHFTKRIIARRKIDKQRERRRQWANIPLDDSISETTDRAPDDKYISDMLSELTAPQRKIVNARLDGKYWREIASIMKTSEREIDREMRRIRSAITAQRLNEAQEVNMDIVSRIIEKQASKLENDQDSILVVERKTARLNALQQDAIKRQLESAAKPFQCGIVVSHDSGNLFFYLVKLTHPHYRCIEAGKRRNGFSVSIGKPQPAPEPQPIRV